MYMYISLSVQGKVLTLQCNVIIPSRGLSWCKCMITIQPLCPAFPSYCSICKSVTEQMGTLMRNFSFYLEVAQRKIFFFLPEMVFVEFPWLHFFIASRKKWILNCMQNLNINCLWFINSFILTTSGVMGQLETLTVNIQ